MAYVMDHGFDICGIYIPGWLYIGFSAVEDYTHAVYNDTFIRSHFRLPEYMNSLRVLTFELQLILKTAIYL